MSTPCWASEHHDWMRLLQRSSFAIKDSPRPSSTAHRVASSRTVSATSIFSHLNDSQGATCSSMQNCGSGAAGQAMQVPVTVMSDETPRGCKHLNLGHIAFTGSSALQFTDRRFQICHRDATRVLCLGWIMSKESHNSSLTEQWIRAMKAVKGGLSTTPHALTLPLITHISWFLMGWSDIYQFSRVTLTFLRAQSPSKSAT